MKRAGTGECRRPWALPSAWAAALILAAILCGRQTVEAAEEAQAQQGAMVQSEVTVAMTEVPVWEVSERARDSFLRGAYAHVQTTRQGSYTYPQFKSATPLYGQVSFPGVTHDSGRSPSFWIALDHSQGTADTYDRLYFDANGDQDLTNDPPLKARTDVPAALAQKYSSIREQIWFEPVKITFDFGPAGRRPVEMMPRLRIYEEGSQMLNFVATTVRAGTFEIAGTTYQAYLGYQHAISGRLDQPRTTLILGPDGHEPYRWWGGDELKAIHSFGGRLYRFSCTPTGDQVQIRPYEGKLGVFELGAGGRDVKKFEMSGSVNSQETAVAVGDTAGEPWPRATRRCEIPVGDYYPAIMSISFDSIRLSISNNYHTNAQGQARGNRETVAGIAIREDKPYTLDFSNKPVVVFEQPKADGRVRLGEEMEVAAVLVDPVLDIMIRGLDDTAAMQTESYKDNDGTERTFQRPKSLDPNVVIRRADGEIVAEGVMPFG
ncbi:MAG: hypothetical protein ABFE13_19255 [Phycisphaerales bacterium]